LPGKSVRASKKASAPPSGTEITSMPKAIITELRNAW
jgi:hypothetical protein